MCEPNDNDSGPAPIRSRLAAQTLGLVGGVVTSVVLSACYGAPPGTDLQPPPDTGDLETGDTGDTGDVEDTGGA